MELELNKIGSTYHCKIPDSVNVTQTIYIGVCNVNTSNGELSCLCFLHSIVLTLQGSETPV